MFNRIAPYYDFLNRLLSLRRDVHWRRMLASCLALPKDALVLDVACGTGDVALEIIRRAGSRVRVVGVDFAPEMLRVALSKRDSGDRNKGLHLVAADAFGLPFAAGRFDAVTIAFGIRNIQDKVNALRHLCRHLKPGGRLAVLELGMPDQGLLGRLFGFYFSRLLPRVGRLFSKHGFAYSYLPASVALFPAPDAFSAQMRMAGLKKVRYRRMTLGIAVLFRGDKPAHLEGLS